jgi:hypothetical protein
MKHDEQTQRLIIESMNSLINNIQKINQVIYTAINPHCNREAILRLAEPQHATLIAAIQVAIDHRLDIIQVMQEAKEYYVEKDIEEQRNKIIQYKSILKWLHPTYEPESVSKSLPRRSPTATSDISCC